MLQTTPLIRLERDKQIAKARIAKIAGLLIQLQREEQALFACLQRLKLHCSQQELKQVLS